LVVLQFCCFGFGVLEFCSFVVWLFGCFRVLQFCCLVVLEFCCFVVLLFGCFGVLQFYSVWLFYSFAGILLCYFL